MKTAAYVGWDIGGAHLKAVVCQPRSQSLKVFQQPCPLWQGLDQLENAARRIISDWPPGQYRHAITMTGELVDLFASRDEGVAAIIKAMAGLLPGQEIWLFAGRSGLLRLEKIIPSHYPDIASSNWLASAGFAAQKLGNGLFVDIGSTTTDILLLADGQVKAQGFTDYQRLCSQELVYTGIIRTAVMAVAQIALDEGKEIGLMAEYFATMADVYRLTGELNEAHDQTVTADGAEKTVAASARRLARMVGCDFVPEALPRWRRLAENIRSQQLAKIRFSCNLILQSSPATQVPLVGAGVGRFLAKEVAAKLMRPYLDFGELLAADLAGTGLDAADCAPAAALALWLVALHNGHDQAVV